MSCLRLVDVKDPSQELAEDDSVTPLAAGHVSSCLRLVDVKSSNKEPVEDDGVTPWAGEHVVSRLPLLDVKDPAKSSWKTTVTHQWLEDML